MPRPTLDVPCPNAVHQAYLQYNVQGASADKPHLAFGKSNFEIKPFLRHWKKKKTLQANSLKWILYTETFTVLYMDFGAPRRPSISPKSDANEDLHILNSYTFEKHQTFPNKKEPSGMK